MSETGRKQNNACINNQHERQKAQAGDEKSPMRTFVEICTHQDWVLAAHFARRFITETGKQRKQLQASRFILPADDALNLKINCPENHYDKQRGGCRRAECIPPASWIQPGELGKERQHCDSTGQQGPP